MNTESLSQLFKSPLGEEVISYFQDVVDQFVKEENERLEKILAEPHPETEELIALKVIARTRGKIKGILNDIIALKDYIKAEMEEEDMPLG